MLVILKKLCFYDFNVWNDGPWDESVDLHPLIDWSSSLALGSLFQGYLPDLWLFSYWICFGGTTSQDNCIGNFT